MSLPEKRILGVLKIFLLILGMGGVATVLVISQKQETPPSALPFVIPHVQPSSAATLRSKPKDSSSSFMIPVDSDPKVRWQKFAEKFGSELEPQFDSKGRLISIRGVPGQGMTAARDFRTQDVRQVNLRGQEILHAAQDLLGINPELPLSPPIPQGGPVTAQVYFRETYRGLNLLPEGSLKLDLGPKGEILGLDSDYISELKVNSDFRLSSQEAFVKALASVNRGQSLSVPYVEGNRVVWVIQATQGQAAYRFFIQGREIVIDAGTGRVLSSKNQKQE